MLMDTRIVPGSTVHTDKSKIKRFADDIQLQQIHVICEDNKKQRKVTKKEAESVIAFFDSVKLSNNPARQS